MVSAEPLDGIQIKDHSEVVLVVLRFLSNAVDARKELEVGRGGVVAHYLILDAKTVEVQ